MWKLKDNAVMGIMLAIGLVLGFSAMSASAKNDTTPDWKEKEKGILENHVQLTFPDQFTRAGEAYFSPDDSKIIFQATEVPREGEEPDPFYAMYIADIVCDENDRIAAIENIRRISPEGSANTCGWFHPHNPNVAIFASTVGSPSESDPPGFQRRTGRYRWMFPPEMNIVQVNLDEADGSEESLEHIIGDPEAYIAECSFSPDGRHLLYCSLESNLGDLFVKDTKTGRTTRIVEAAGYDGGPFFSPDGQRITYRSDRRGNNLLQIYVSHLTFNEAGTIIGVEREYQLTDNEHVNWAPFWHPGGRHIVYASSEVSHRQYEIFIIDADPGYMRGSEGTIRYGTKKRRVTHAEGFDGLPVFNSDGSIMMWTSQRDGSDTSQIWIADFVKELDHVPSPRGYRPSGD